MLWWSYAALMQPYAASPAASLYLLQLYAGTSAASFPDCDGLVEPYVCSHFRRCVPFHDGAMKPRRDPYSLMQPSAASWTEPHM